MMPRDFVAMIAAIVMSAGCNARDGSNMNRAPHAFDQRQLVSLPTASAEVSRMLYERNLIADPDVNRKLNEAVLQITRDGASPDSVIPAFLRWLEDWASTHPAHVEAARLIGGAYTLEARRVFVDSDSSRRVQTDSIRRLVRERARRRIEAARAALRSAQSN